MCQLFISAMPSTSLKVFQDTTGEYVLQESTYSIDLCTPTHNWDFWLLIYPMGFLCLFIDQTIVSGILSFGTWLDGIPF